MSTIVALSVNEVMPDRAEMGRISGVPPDRLAGGHDRAEQDRLPGLIEQALDLLRSCAEPAGIVREVTREQFAVIYAGEGRNAPESPLASIHPRAERLALFAATVGTRVSGRIAELFQAREFALATLLDGAASAAAERAASAVEAHWLGTLSTRAAAGPSIPAGGVHAVRYSPGYCGWHLTGQRTLFEALHPQEIGMTLRESCLMEPLKSISGVIVVGRREIHAFTPDYPFCTECRTRGCRERMRG
jgi:hypothetical protein